jgi:hypothetical protein
VPFADLSQAVEFGVERFVHRIGRIVEGRNGVKQVEVYPTSKRGYIATGILLNVDVGEYTIEPLVELSEHPDLKQWVEANEPVVAVDTSSVCERKIHAQEFAVGSSPGPVLRCDISKPRLIRLNVFWLGKVPIRFSGIRLQRVATTIGTTQHS